MHDDETYKARREGGNERRTLYDQTMMPGKWNENGRREGGKC